MLPYHICPFNNPHLLVPLLSDTHTILPIFITCLCTLIMFYLAAFRSNLEEEIGTLIRANKAKLLALTREYSISPPHGALKNELHNLIIDHLAEKELITSEEKEQTKGADQSALTLVNLKIELAYLEAEADIRRRKMRSQDAALAREQKFRAPTTPKTRSYPPTRMGE